MSPRMHWHTPQITANDPRGLPVRHVACLRNVFDGPVQSLISRQSHNAAGHLVEQRDPRLAEAPLPANQQTIHRLDGMALKITSVDAGWRVSLPGLAGEALERWDARGSHWRTAYDDQLRVVTVEEDAQPDVETFTYADASADAGHNLRGQLLEQVDPSGSLYLDSYGLLGQSLHETRTFDDAKGFVSSRTYSPMGSLITQTDAGGHQQQMRYTVAGQLKQVFLQLSDQSQPKPILQEARYNAAAQIETQTTANGVVSTWSYDPADGRLMTLKSGKPGETLRQNLAYRYDPMGNVLRIEDHSLTTVYFANQRVDGHRDFTYDSLYRLTGASGFEAQVPNLQPGLPELISPIDPGRRYHYREQYDYDAGNNLTELRHIREGNTYTRRMRIDPYSNRGVRWEDGDPEPIFDERFDRHGNQCYLQTGVQPLIWNARDQLAKVTLLTHSNGLPDDEETYRYSQGERVYKRHVSHTPSATHSREVRYLPGLEIHVCSDGQTLHVITLAMGLSGSRCLHWVAGQPADIEPDQLRYHYDDHLGSCAVELDGNGALMSLEAYYPFGGTAWWAARSAVEADYKTIRYSGKEMDLSGLYYFGARYYAPWLWRWISADPAGDVDGLNLYTMVNDNPLRYIDPNGANQEESAARQQITEYSNLLSQVNSEVKKLNYQLYNLTRTRDIYKTAGKKLLFSVATFAVTIKAGAFGAVIGGGAASVTGPAAPVLVPVAAAVGGIFAADAANKVMEKLGEETTLGYTIKPDPSALSVSRLKSKASAPPFSVKAVVNSFNPQTSEGLTKTVIETTARTMGKHLKVPYLKQGLAIARQAAQLTEALNGAWGQGDLDQISAKLDELTTFLDSKETQALESFETLANAAPAPGQLVGAAQMPMPSDNDLPTLQQQMKVARSAIRQSRSLLVRVSQYLAEKQHAA